MRPIPKVLAVAGFKLGIVVDRLPDCLYPVPALSAVGADLLAHPIEPSLCVSFLELGNMAGVLPPPSSFGRQNPEWQAAMLPNLGRRPEPDRRS